MIACPLAREGLDHAFVEGTGLATALETHLEGCAGCREYRGRLFRIDAVLDGGRAGVARAEVGLGRFARDALRESLIAGASAGAATATPAQGVSSGAAARGLRGWWRWLSLGTATAAAAAALLLIFARPGGEGGDFEARRGQPGTLAVAQAPTGLRALCVVDEADGPRIEPLDDVRAGKRTTCRLRDRLGLAYRNETGRPRHAVIGLRAPDGRWRAIYETRARTPLPPTGAEAPEEPLGAPVALLPGERGRLEIHAHFDDAPLDPVRALAMLERRASSAGTPRLIVEIVP